MSGSGDEVSFGPPVDPRVGRQRWLVLALRVALVAVFVAGVAELFAPDELQDDFGRILVGLLVAVAVGRVLWLVIRWCRRRDWRFAAAGAALILVLAVGYLIA